MVNKDYVMLHANDARLLATQLHAKHVRKYIGVPYIHHNAEMVGMFFSMFCNELTPKEINTYCSVIWLHDVIEDCGVTREWLATHFTDDIAEGVWWLSDIDQQGNRAERKRQTRSRLLLAPEWIQTIKCLDLWSNCTCIFVHDKSFAPVFAMEAEQLLKESLIKADPRAIALVQEKLTAYRATKEKKKE